MYSLTGIQSFKDVSFKLLYSQNLNAPSKMWEAAHHQNNCQLQSALF